MNKLIFIFLFLPFTLSAQDEKTKNIEKDKSKKGGWAVHLGAGFMYGGNIGFLIEKQIILNKKLRISPFAAAGFAEGGTDSTSNRYYWFGVSAGSTLEYGKKHRAIFGLYFTDNNIIGNSVEVKKERFSGISTIIGYKGTAKYGLIWQVYAGNIYMQDDDALSENKKYSHNSQVGIGIGYKF